MPVLKQMRRPVERRGAPDAHDCRDLANWCATNTARFEGGPLVLRWPWPALTLEQRWELIDLGEKGRQGVNLADVSTSARGKVGTSSSVFSLDRLDAKDRKRFEELVERCADRKGAFERERTRDRDRAADRKLAADIVMLRFGPDGTKALLAGVGYEISKGRMQASDGALLWFIAACFEMATPLGHGNTISLGDGGVPVLTISKTSPITRDLVVANWCDRLVALSDAHWLQVADRRNRMEVRLGRRILDLVAD